MQTVTGYAGVRASAAEELVAPRRAISADDVDLTIGIVDSRGQIVKQVEYARIEMAYLTGAVVAEKVVEFRQSLRRVRVAVPVHNVEPLARVRVIEAKPILPASLCCDLRRVQKWRDKEQNETKNRGAELCWHLISLIHQYRRRPVVPRGTPVYHSGTGICGRSRSAGIGTWSVGR